MQSLKPHRSELFSKFTQDLIRTFDEERSEKSRPTPPWEEASNNTVIALREKPSTPAVGSTNTLKRGTLATIEDVPKAHKGMYEFPCLNISKKFMEIFGDLFSYGPGSNITAEIE